eukprot:3010566-Rhodomonas_salina.2
MQYAMPGTGIRLAADAMCGTESAYGCTTHRGSCYAVCGADVGYAATRVRVHGHVIASISY